MKKIIFIISLFVSVSGFATTNQDTIGVGVDEKLGDYLPMDLTFATSDGDTLSLDEIINEPVLIAPIYYECPDICSPLLTELAWVAPKIELEPGKDFKIITLSFDHKENSAIAARWKKNYFVPLKSAFPQSAWTFLTGDSISIKKFTDAIGFRFKPSDDGKFIHPSMVLTVAPDGKISRYLFGTRFNQFDLKMALLDAKAGKTNPTISQVLQFCFSYDPEGRTYTLNITRIIGVLMLTMVGLVFIAVTFKKKSRKNKELS